MKAVVTYPTSSKFYVLFAVAFGMFVDSLSYGIVVPLLPYFADSFLKLTSFESSLFVAFYAIGLMLFVPFVTLLSNKIGNKNSLIFAGIILAFSLICFPFTTNLNLLFLGRFLQGASAAITWTAGLALVAQSVHPQNRSSALGTVMVGVSVGHLLGAPLSGVLFEFGGILLPFLLVAMISLLSAFLFVFIRSSSVFLQEKNQYTNTDFLKLIFKSKLLLLLSFVVLVESYMISMLEPTLALHTARFFSASSLSIGLLFGIHVLFLGLLSPLVGILADKYGKFKMIVIGLFFSGLILLGMAQAESLFSYFICMALLGITSAFFMSPILSAFADEMDKTHLKGLYHIAYSVFNFIYALGMVAGPFAGAYLSQDGSIEPTLTCLGALMLVAVPLFGLTLVWNVHKTLPFAKDHSQTQESEPDRPQDCEKIVSNPH